MAGNCAYSYNNTDFNVVRRKPDWHVSERRRKCGCAGGYEQIWNAKLRASIVCEPTLALCTKPLDLGKYLRLGRGEDHTGGRKRKSILSDALEAVIGAIYLDGGFTNAKEFVLRFIMTDIENKQLFYDSKTILQELIQGRHEQLSYELIDESGPDHDKQFTVAVLVDGERVSEGEGHTKKAAEQQAAYQALLLYRNRE